MGCCAGGSAPKMAKTVQGMATNFWDYNVILLIDYLANGRTINLEYFPSLF